MPTQLTEQACPICRLSADKRLSNRLTRIAEKRHHDARLALKGNPTFARRAFRDAARLYEAARQLEGVA